MVVVFLSMQKFLKIYSSHLLCLWILSPWLKSVGVGTLLRREQTLGLEEPNCRGTLRPVPQPQVSSLGYGSLAAFFFLASVHGHRRASSVSQISLQRAEGTE